VHRTPRRQGRKAYHGLVFDVSVSGARILPIAAGVLITVAIIASFLPARRAGRIDPMAVLRDA
jgi:putative ABC transport system permease protein